MVTVGDVTGMLDHAGSNQDPIWYRGVETTAQDLAYAGFAEKDAARVRVQFYGMKGQSVRRRTGTLIDMLVDRIGYRPKRKRRKT